MNVRDYFLKIPEAYLVSTAFVFNPDAPLAPNTFLAFRKHILDQRHVPGVLGRLVLDIPIQDVREQGLIVDDPFGGPITLRPNKGEYTWNGNLNSRSGETGAGARGNDNLWPWEQVEAWPMWWIVAIERG